MHRDGCRTARSSRLLALRPLFPNSVDDIFSAGGGGGGGESRGRTRGCAGGEDSWYACLQSVNWLGLGREIAMLMLLFRAPLTNIGNSSYYPWQDEEGERRSDAALCGA
jgi:hypothetical protein